MCIVFRVIAALLLLSWAGVGAWIFWDVRWGWWNASPEEWVVVRRRLEAWSWWWFLLLAAGFVGVALAATFDC